MSSACSPQQPGLTFCTSTERMKFPRAQLLAASLIISLVACNRSPTPSAVKTPDGTGPSGTSASKPQPPAGDAVVDPFDRQVRDYLDQTKPLREAAAKIGDSVARSDKPADAEAAVRARQTALGAQIRERIRPTAKQGDIFSEASAKAIRQRLSAAFSANGRDGVRQELQEQNDEPKGNAKELAVNSTFRAPKVPPEILTGLPAVPEPLEYAFHDRTLILRDADADLVIDFLPRAFPESPPQAPVPKAEGHSPHATLPLFALPNLSGALTFAVIGDSGTGDDAQKEIASEMFRYYTEARKFAFVLILGDNLYGDDYTGEFALPYKELLDAKVPFYATLGNHDRDNERHYKPFNMNGVDRYKFDAGNARFVALNSNRPADPEQMAWLDKAFADVGDKWRIAFFHHPLYF